MQDSTAVIVSAHIYGGDRTDVSLIDFTRPFLSVRNGPLSLSFNTPEALSGFLLAIASSEAAQQFLAQAGAGFSMTVEPLPQPAPTTYCSGCGFVAGVYPSHRTGCPVAAGDAIDAAMQRAELRQEAGL